MILNLEEVSAPPSDGESIVVPANTGQLLLGNGPRVLGPKKLKLVVTLRRTTLEDAALGFNEVTQE